MLSILQPWASRSLATPLRVRLLVGLLLACTGCSAVTTPASTQYVVALAYSVGPERSEMYLFDDGTIRYVLNSRGYGTRFPSSEDRERMKQALDNPELSVALHLLRESGYEPGCCDQGEVEIHYRSEGYSVGYAACRTGGEEAATTFFVEFVNEIGSRYYPRRFVPFPTSACAKGASIVD